MQVVYLTDIHDNFAGISSVLNQTDADLYIISGDLTYHAFGSDEGLFRFIELQEQIRRLLGKEIPPGATRELADRAASGEAVSGLTSDEAKEYVTLAAEAHEELKRKYQTLKKAIVATQKNCFIIPGNYDLPLADTAVAPYSLHAVCKEFQGIRFAGYGSAPVFTPGIPEELAIQFEESGTGNSLQSPPMDFMLAERAEIFVLHNPAYGTLDKLSRFGHCGSHGLRHAVDEVIPRLVLSGHVHESFGLMKLGQTYFLNPSNFGRVEAMEGEQPGGYFSTFQLQKDADGQVFVREVTWKRLLNGSIRDLCNVKIDKKQRATETILDTAEYEHMGAFLL
jgi:uncharacterized protein